MPNTPAMVGRGITAICGNAHATAAHLALARDLMAAVGQVVELDGEHQIDAVTAVSGSGPAYVFHLIEAMAAAGEAEGLPADVAMQLARATVCGAGELAFRSPDSAAQLRVNVTSPGGTTAAALAVLMDPEAGFPALLTRARSRRRRTAGGSWASDFLRRFRRRSTSASAASPGRTLPRGAQARLQAVGRFRRIWG